MRRRFADCLEADSKIVVTTADIAHFQEDFSRWIRQVGAVFGLQPDGFELMAVQTDRHAKHSEFTIKDIRKETQLHLIGQVSGMRMRFLVVIKANCWTCSCRPTPCMRRLRRFLENSSIIISCQGR